MPPRGLTKVGPFFCPTSGSTADAAGHARVDHGLIDIGAYESDFVFVAGFE